MFVWKFFFVGKNFLFLGGEIVLKIVYMSIGEI